MIIRILVIMALTVLLATGVTAQANPWAGNWIWSNVPREDNYLRATVEAKNAVVQARIAVTADNIYELYVNGKSVGSDANWTDVEVYDVTDLVRKGANIIAVKATDPGADVGAVLLEGAFTYADGTATVFGTDTTWRISSTGNQGWRDVQFDDSGWENVRVIGKPPIGPWGGLDHPLLVPKSPMEVVAVYWPKKANPEDTLTVVCKVRPKQKILLDSPVALRLLSDGQTVYEQWMEPDQPTSEWDEDEVVRLTFKDYRLPNYVPRGKLQAQVVTTATDSLGQENVWIGPRAEPVKPKQIVVNELTAKPVSHRAGRAVRFDVEADGEAPAGFTMALFKGNEMWFAQSTSRTPLMLILPENLPAGTYTAKLLAHKALISGKTECGVTVGGPEESCWKPFGYGTYEDRNGVPHHWYINSQGALIWDGEPYVPIGGMYLSSFFGEFRTTDPDHNEAAYAEDLKRIAQLRKAGVTDIYLNPCCHWEDKPAWVWETFANMCEEAGLNCGLQLTNPLLPLKGYHIAQDEYVVTIEAGETATAHIRGTYFGRPHADNKVLFAAFDAESGDLVDWGEADIESEGEAAVAASAKPEAPLGGQVTVHFVPEYTFRGDMHDYWQAVNSEYKQRLDDFFSKFDLGDNFRLFIDPLDNEQSFRDMNRMLPHSQAYRDMFRDYLEQKYPSIGELISAWGVSGDGLDYAACARLVPLGKPSLESTIGCAVDETSRKTYAVDLAKSAMWHDMLRFRDSSIAEFNCKMADWIKSHVDVPVVLKVTDTDCFVNPHTYGGFDGLGMEAYGSAPELVRGCGGGVYSRCKQANRTMWTLTTETGLGESFVGYPDPIRLTKELGSMLEMNGKGTFCFLLSPPSGRKGVGWYYSNLLEDPRQLYWLGAYNALAKSSAQLPRYEPEVDYYFPGMIAGEQSGFATAQPSFYSDVPSQSIAGNTGRWVVPASTWIPSDARRVIVNLEDSPATEIFGADFEDILKTRDVVVVGHRRNLGALSIDSYYTDKFVTDADGKTVQVLSPTPTCEVFARAADGSICGIKDGKVTLYSKSDWVSSVREMAGPADGVDFFRDILGLEEMDLGDAFQGMHFGSSTYLWNMTDKTQSLDLRIPETSVGFMVLNPEMSDEAAPGGDYIDPGQTTELPIPARAAGPVIIHGLKEVELEGIDKANLASALLAWDEARKNAKAVGVDSDVAPPSGDWREIYAAAEALTAKAEDVYRTTTASRMEDVDIDGELGEWTGVEPIYLQMDVGIDITKVSPYQGAEFYVGYDEQYLYLAGKITDEAVVNNYRGGGIWNGDAVEVFVDLDPEAEPSRHSYHSNCFQFIFSPTNVAGSPDWTARGPSLPDGSTPKDSLWKPLKTDSGWQFELAIGRGDLNNFVLSSSKVIGFTIQLDDSDGGDRTSAKLWRGDNPSWNRLSFGRLVLDGDAE